MADGTKIEWDELGGRDDGPALDGIIVGGESGPGARPMHPDWARSLRDQCAAAGVDFHFKQWGSWRCIPDADRDYPHRDAVEIDGALMQRIEKSAAGRELDGRTHDDLPWRRTS